MISLGIPSEDDADLDLAIPLQYSNEGQSDLTIWDDILSSRGTPKRRSSKRKNSDATQCGSHRDSGSRAMVVNGRESKLNAHPWMVQILDETGHLICGGSIISRSFILTAAHCAEPASILKAGIHEENVIPTDKEQKRRIVKKHVHESFENKDHGVFNDIAILESDRPLHWNNAVRPICLPKSKDDRVKRSRLSYVKNAKNKRPKKVQKRTRSLSKAVPTSGTTLTVAGWGISSFEGGDPMFPGHLREGVVPVQKEKSCNSFYLDRYRHDTMFCAGHDDSSKTDTCSGDSGGPAMRQNNDQWTIYGITSWGTATCDYGFGVYTRVSSFIDWIEGIVGGV